MSEQTTEQRIDELITELNEAGKKGLINPIPFIKFFYELSDQHRERLQPPDCHVNAYDHGHYFDHTCPQCGYCPNCGRSNR